MTNAKVVDDETCDGQRVFWDESHPEARLESVTDEALTKEEMGASDKSITQRGYGAETIYRFQ